MPEKLSLCEFTNDKKKIAQQSSKKVKQEHIKALHPLLVSLFNGSELALKVELLFHQQCCIIKMISLCSFKIFRIIRFGSWFLPALHQAISGSAKTHHSQRKSLHQVRVNLSSQGLPFCPEERCLCWWIDWHKSNKVQEIQIPAAVNIYESPPLRASKWSCSLSLVV